MATTQAEKKDPFLVENVRIAFEDATPEFREVAIGSAKQHLIEYYKGEKKHYYEVAKAVKTDVDAAQSGTFHVIVGKSFGSFVSFEVGTMLYFFLGSVGFLVFRHG
mmetsp:Transcript_18616/g.59267  ORF Transcript_18616/g.59267 Transcript_18616/m.59267 type:complete len:106 (-) Transcript_18616:1345-1662(-)